MSLYESMKFLYNRLLFIIILALIVSSCAHKKGRHEKIDVPAGEKSERAIEAKGKDQNYFRQQLKYLVEARMYGEALNLIDRIEERGNEKTVYLNEYVGAVNGFIEEGKMHLKKNNYEKSGMIFKRVIEVYPRKGSLREKISEEPEKIKDYIHIASEKLLEEGLQMYREGNIDKAVTIWKKILTFNPDYAEAKSAIETASIQMNNLRSLENGNR